jgi:hypothetical protein
MNAATHCLTVTAQAAKMGDRTYRRLPKRLQYIQQEAGRFASKLYADREANGEPVSREEWEAIQTAAAWELHRLNVLRVLRTDKDSTPEKDIQRSAELAKAQEKRALWVKQLHHATQQTATRGLRFTTSPQRPQKSRSREQASKWPQVQRMRQRAA